MCVDARVCCVFRTWSTRAQDFAPPHIIDVLCRAQDSSAVIFVIAALHACQFWSTNATTTTVRWLYGDECFPRTKDQTRFIYICSTYRNRRNAHLVLARGRSVIMHVGKLYVRRGMYVVFFVIWMLRRLEWIFEQWWGGYIRWCAMRVSASGGVQDEVRGIEMRGSFIRTIC